MPADLAHRIQPWGPNLVPQPSSLTRLDALVAAGGYDESLRYAMDLDTFLRLATAGRRSSRRGRRWRRSDGMRTP